MTLKREEKFSMGYVEIAMASSFAVSGSVILHSLWTGDMRYLEGAGAFATAAAWALGVTLTVFAVIVAFGLWRQASRPCQWTSGE